MENNGSHIDTWGDSEIVVMLKMGRRTRMKEDGFRDLRSVLSRSSLSNILNDISMLTEREKKEFKDYCITQDLRERVERSKKI